MPVDIADSRFWRFSLAYYRLPGVEQTLLEWQESAGADVNVVLYLLYLATEGRGLGASDVERIAALTEPWRDTVVAPLRAVRRALKSSVGAFEPDSSAALRAAVKRVELTAERLQQVMLERLAAPDQLGEASGADARAGARVHLELYSGRLGATGRAPIEPLVEALAPPAASD